jgi:hypothetical protein
MVFCFQYSCHCEQSQNKPSQTEGYLYLSCVTFRHSLQSKVLYGITCLTFILLEWVFKLYCMVKEKCVITTEKDKIMK